MRILIVSDAWHPQVNGVVRTYESIIRELEKRGHIVKVIGPADFRWTMALPGYPEIRLALFPYGPLKKIIEDFAPDTFHIATEGPLGWAARKYCLEAKKAFSTCYHTHFPDYTAKRLARYFPALYKPAQAFGKFFVRKFHGPSDIILVATPGLRDVLGRWGFKNPMHIFSRGVDTDIFHPGPKKLFRDLPQPVALYVGRVAIEKNIEDFLKMEWPGAKIIVGDGPMLNKLLRTYPNAYFTGRKTGAELAEHYRAADVFAFPSRTDTFGIVLLEALACGLPIAAYNVTGPKDIVKEDILGALEENDLAAAARRALTKGSAEERASYIRQYYNWENAAGQFEEALLKVSNLGEKG